MLRGVLIAWAVCASSFAGPAAAWSTPAQGGSVDAAAIAAADVAPNRPAPAQRDTIAPTVALEAANAGHRTLDIASEPPASSIDFDRRAERRRVVPRRAPPRLGDDGFH